MYSCRNIMSIFDFVSIWIISEGLFRDCVHRNISFKKMYCVYTCLCGPPSICLCPQSLTVKFSQQTLSPHLSSETYFLFSFSTPLSFSSFYLILICHSPYLNTPLQLQTGASWVFQVICLLRLAVFPQAALKADRQKHTH